MTSTNSIRESRHPKLVLWDNPEGWGREGGGSGVQDGGTHVHPWMIHVDVWQKPPQYCKVITLQKNKYIFLNEFKLQGVTSIHLSGSLSLITFY